MPIQALSSVSIGSEDERAKKQLLDRIQNEVYTKKIDNRNEDSDDDFMALEESSEKERLRSLQEYRDIAEQTREVKLERLIQIPEGCSIFDELCLRIDINQRYASVLPQWKDVADVLEVDQIRTLWVETCVRPREGLTRAMLEIYMKDGGTLGDLIDALIRLELYDVLGVLREKLTKFCDKFVVDGHLLGVNYEPEMVDEKFFSVLKTLASAFRGGDPCQDIQRYSGGLKNFCRGDVVLENVGLVQSGPPADAVMSHSMPTYRSELHLNRLKDEKSKFEDSDDLKGSGSSRSCKILLLFSEDGVQASDLAISLAEQVTYEGCRVDFFRLNETSLWYEMLTNPEGCCMKWSSEADFIMPILTPKFLQEIHGNRDENDNADFIPTSPILNRYMYTLARAQYTRAGCKNYKVRPVIPLEHLREVRTCNAVTVDPILNHVWIPMTNEKMTARLKGLLQEFVKKNRR